MAGRWQTLAGLAQDLETRIGEQRMRTPGALERVCDELRKTFALDDRPHLNARLNAPGERCIGRPFERLR